MTRRLFIILSFSLLLAATGCTSSMRPGKLSHVQAHSDKHRAGNAYLLRGFIGVFSAGIDNLTQQINESGVRAHVYQDEQWSLLAAKLKQEYAGKRNAEPLILIGHSYGADDVIRVARELEKKKIEVDLLVTLDPVTPPPVPANVKRCVNIYQSNGLWDALPWLRGVPVTRGSNFRGELANYNIRGDRKDLLDRNTDHFNIEKKPKIHQEILRHVVATCPPRPTWLAMHRAPTSPLRGRDTLSTAMPAAATIAPANASPVGAHDSHEFRLGN